MPRLAASNDQRGVLGLVHISTYLVLVFYYACTPTGCLLVSVCYFFNFLFFYFRRFFLTRDHIHVIPLAGFPLSCCRIQKPSFVGGGLCAHLFVRIHIFLTGTRLTSLSSLLFYFLIFLLFCSQASARPALAVRPVEPEDAGGALHLGGPDEFSGGGTECRLGLGARQHALPRRSVLHRRVLFHRGVRFPCLLLATAAAACLCQGLQNGWCCSAYYGGP